MSIIQAILGYGWSVYGTETSNKSHQCRENRKKRFAREKKSQRLALRMVHISQFQRMMGMYM